jgi:hypothetical protein
MTTRKEKVMARRMSMPALLAVLTAFTCEAQMIIPEGTRIRVRLENTVSSAKAEEGQTVEFSVTEPVRIDKNIVIAEGARVTGTITEAHEKRRMGRAGKLDFSIDRVKATDNQWVPLRYTVTKKAGESHAVRTGVITAGVAAVFWPAAPVMLLMKGKDVTINKGFAFDVYTDGNHLLGGGGPASQAASAAAQTSMPPPFKTAPGGDTASGSATVTITASVAGADIDVDGAFIGSTPTTVQLSSGPHRVIVRANDRTWERTLQVSPGSTVSLNATLK